MWVSKSIIREEPGIVCIIKFYEFIRILRKKSREKKKISIKQKKNSFGTSASNWGPLRPYYKNLSI